MFLTKEVHLNILLENSVCKSTLLISNFSYDIYDILLLLNLSTKDETESYHRCIWIWFFIFTIRFDFDRFDINIVITHYSIAYVKDWCIKIMNVDSLTIIHYFLTSLFQNAHFKLIAWVDKIWILNLTILLIYGL